MPCSMTLSSAAEPPLAALMRLLLRSWSYERKFYMARLFETDRRAISSAADDVVLER